MSRRDTEIPRHNTHSVKHRCKRHTDCTRERNQLSAAQVTALSSSPQKRGQSIKTSDAFFSRFANTREHLDFTVEYFTSV